MFSFLHSEEYIYIHQLLGRLLQLKYLNFVLNISNVQIACVPMHVWGSACECSKYQPENSMFSFLRS
jgi:uncharacterized metal-binding protein